VCSLGALRRAARVVVQEDVEEALLVADVQQAGLVEVVEAFDESGRPAEGRDQTSHVLRHVECVEPGAAFIRLVAIGVEVAGGEVQERRAEDWVLEAPGAV
jgi:hypothetical protein